MIIYIHPYIYTYIYIYIHTHELIFVYTYIYIYTCSIISTLITASCRLTAAHRIDTKPFSDPSLISSCQEYIIYTYINQHRNMYIYIYTYMCACFSMYIYIHIYIYVQCKENSTCLHYIYTR